MSPIKEGLYDLMLPIAQAHQSDGAGTGGALQFSPITLNADYAKKWNASHTNDFIFLTRNGAPIRNTLYRIGGMGTPKLGKDEYFLLIKHVEAFYPDSITKITKDKPHLEGRWCILDKNGNEKVEFEAFRSPYLVKDSVIYFVNGKYHNIETGELYCDTSSSMESGEFLFLENRFDKDTSRRGVMKIHKKTGKWELFPESK